MAQCTGASKWVPVCSPVLMSFQYHAGPRSSYRLISCSEKDLVFPNGSGSLITGVSELSCEVRSMTSIVAARMAEMSASSTGMGCLRSAWVRVIRVDGTSLPYRPGRTPGAGREGRARRPQRTRLSSHSRKMVV